MSWLLSREMRQYVPDTQCGFRLYQCDEIPFISTESALCRRIQGNPPLHVAARGIRIDAVPIAVILPGRKQINPMRDTLRFIAMIYRYRRQRARRARRSL